METPKGKAFSEMTKDELMTCAKVGGQKSGEARRRKREMKDVINVILSMPMKSGKTYDVEQIKRFVDFKGKNVDVQTAMIVAQIQKALKGDLQATQFIRDTIGQAPVKEAKLETNSQDVNLLAEIVGQMKNE